MREHLVHAFVLHDPEEQHAILARMRRKEPAELLGSHDVMRGVKEKRRAALYPLEATGPSRSSNALSNMTSFEIGMGDLGDPDGQNEIIELM